jgi:hypothetical protein
VKSPMPIHPGVLSHISYHDLFIQKRHLRYEHNYLITLPRLHSFLPISVMLAYFYRIFGKQLLLHKKNEMIPPEYLMEL